MPLHTSRPVLALVLALAAAAPAQDAPVFSDPTTIDNAFAPFVPGSVKIYRGLESGARTASMDNFLEELRSFTWNEQTIACRVFEEQEFEDGRLVEIARSWLAQDDLGNVWLFGEVSIEYAEGEPVGTEPDSWLVGGPLPEEDPAIRSFDEPAVFMPATLAEGDVFVQDNDPETLETLTVLAIDARVKVVAGRFEDAVRLQEIDDGEDGAPELRWIVPGIGTVKERAKGLRRQLIATSLVETAIVPDEEP